MHKPLNVEPVTVHMQAPALHMGLETVTVLLWCVRFLICNKLPAYFPSGCLS